MSGLWALLGVGSLPSGTAFPSPTEGASYHSRAEVYKHWLMGWEMPSCQVIPLYHGADQRGSSCGLRGLSVSQPGQLGQPVKDQPVWLCLSVPGSG